MEFSSVDSNASVYLYYTILQTNTGVLPQLYFSKIFIYLDLNTKCHTVAKERTNKQSNENYHFVWFWWNQGYTVVLNIALWDEKVLPLHKGLKLDV